MYHALYTDNFKEYAKYAYFLFNKYKPETITLTGRSDFFPFARFHANHIIYNGLMKNKNIKWFEKKVLFIKNEIIKVQSQFQVVILCLIVEAIVISGKTELAMLFIDEYEIFLKKNIKNNRIVEEEDSLIKLIFYFHYVFQNLNLLEQNLYKPISNIIEKPEHAIVNFKHSYSYFLDMIKQFYTNDLHEKDKYINKAAQHAKIINNKLFFKLTGKSYS